MKSNRVLYSPLNGRFTTRNYYKFPCSYEVAIPQTSGNLWSVSENNSNNACNVNFNSGNTNNNNKYNSNVVRPVVAFQGQEVPKEFVDSVWEALSICLHGKMSSNQAIEYIAKADEDIPKLAHELWTGTYSPGTSTCFLVLYPKLREVFAASFRDRIVHHWVCWRLNPLFEERFISQGNKTFNCRKGFGTLKALDKLEQSMRDISNNYHDRAYVFKGDLVGFFMSIDKQKMWDLLQKFILRWRSRFELRGWEDLKYVNIHDLGYSQMPEMYWDVLLTTAKKIVWHSPEQDCTINSPLKWWDGLDKNKSLFTSKSGMPIGNLTTQLFANFYMSYFVTYLKWKFRNTNAEVLQFVDDFVIVSKESKDITSKLPEIEGFLKDRLKLFLHKNKRYLQPVSHGVLFVGQYVKPGRRYIANRTRARLAERCFGFKELLGSRDISEIDIDRIEQVLNSYLGFLSHTESFKYRKDYIESIGPEFWKSFYAKRGFKSVRRKSRRLNFLTI